MKYCPNCKSIRRKVNEKGDMECAKCGFINKKGKQPIIFMRG